MVFNSRGRGLITGGVNCHCDIKISFYNVKQGRILVEIVGEVEKNLGKLQRFSSRPPWKVRAQNGPNKPFAVTSKSA